MSFSNFKSLEDTVKEFQIIYRETDFVQEIPFTISDYFRADLDLMMKDAVVDNSEAAICENLIYPILKEVWKSYRQKFLLWSQKFLCCDSSLSGYPEYVLARRSPLGKIVFDKPYFVLVEAKLDNFDAGWGQCLAEMVAAERLNAELNITVFGIVSNGDIWQFSKLTKNQFTRNEIFYTIQELDQLFAVVNYIFRQCELQLDEKVETLVG